MPKALTPDRQTRKVSMAASRWPSSFSAALSAPAMVPSSARPAMAATSSRGKAARSIATAPPARPSST